MHGVRVENGKVFERGPPSSYDRGDDNGDDVGRQQEKKISDRVWGIEWWRKVRKRSSSTTEFPVWSWVVEIRNLFLKRGRGITSKLFVVLLGDVT